MLHLSSKWDFNLYLSAIEWKSSKYLRFRQVGDRQIDKQKDRQRLYQRKVDVDTLNAAQNVLADVSSVSPSSNVSQHILDGVHIHINFSLIQYMFHHYAGADQR